MLGGRMAQVTAIFAPNTYRMKQRRVQEDYDLAKNYWKVLKHRLIKEGNESVTKCNQLKLASPKDGKRYSTDGEGYGTASQCPGRGNCN